MLHVSRHVIYVAESIYVDNEKKNGPVLFVYIGLAHQILKIQTCC